MSLFYLFIFPNLFAFNESHIGFGIDLKERVGAPDNKVGILSHFKASYAVVDLKGASGVDGDGLPSLFVIKSLLDAKSRR